MIQHISDQLEHILDIFHIRIPPQGHGLAILFDHINSQNLVSGSPWKSEIYPSDPPWKRHPVHRITHRHWEQSTQPLFLALPHLFVCHLVQYLSYPESYSWNNVADNNFCLSAKIRSFTARTPTMASYHDGHLLFRLQLICRFRLFSACTLP